MPNVTWVKFMPYEQVENAMARADSVICHAGIGTIMTALKAGHTPVVVPRQARHDEHVDDHQLDIATRFAQQGLVCCVTTETDLAPLLTARSERGPAQIGKGSAELRAAVSSAVAAKSGDRSFGFPRR